MSKNLWMAITILLLFLAPSVALAQYRPPAVQVGYLGAHSSQPEFRWTPDHPQRNGYGQRQVTLGSPDYQSGYASYGNSGYNPYSNPSQGNYYPRQGMNTNERDVLNKAIVVGGGIVIGKTIVDAIKNRSDNKSGEKMAYLSSCNAGNPLACTIIAKKEHVTLPAAMLTYQPLQPAQVTTPVVIQATTPALIWIINGAEDTLEVVNRSTGQTDTVGSGQGVQMPDGNIQGKYEIKGQTFDALGTHNNAGWVFREPSFN